MQTYWVAPVSSVGSADSCTTCSSHTDTSKSEKEFRLVNWNVEVLSSRLVRILRQRQVQEKAPTNTEAVEKEMSRGTARVTDEIVQILNLPEFDPTLAYDRPKECSQQLPRVVQDQLREYVSTIATMYRAVPFHCFEHASHVIMSAEKLMHRILNPDDVEYRAAPDERSGTSEEAFMLDVFDRTYGISGDPLLQFAVVFSSLIHDVDHTGLTNAELHAVEAPVSQLYSNMSSAEQNSVNIAWSLLMSARFKDLRQCIYSDEEELRRFRGFVVNAVMASKFLVNLCSVSSYDATPIPADIADKKLKRARESRWQEAFHPESSAALWPEKVEVDRRATIVFEYIIQAADISHVRTSKQGTCPVGSFLLSSRPCSIGKHIRNGIPACLRSAMLHT